MYHIFKEILFIINNMEDDYYSTEFLIDGAILFNYMITQFKNMFDGDSIIKHFDIRSGIYGRIYECDMNLMKKEYGNDMQHELIHWIKNEMGLGHLFDNKNWKPFRDLEIVHDFYLGYRKMFQYKQLYFQLAIYNICGDCLYCKKENKILSIHFEAALCGWKDKKYDKLQPNNVISILPDNIIPESDWTYSIL